MEDIFIGRQPIYDRKLEVFAYELLFRGSAQNQAQVIDGDQATSQVLVNAFMEIGLEQIAGTRPAFINLTRSFLVSDNPIPFPKDRMVLEILEDMTVDAPLLDAVRRLRHDGYQIALDDFIFNESLRPLVETADIVKIDVLALGRAAISEHVRELRRYPLKLLAEKVESADDFAFCREQGFDYFQGYFLSRPKVIAGQRVPANRLAIMRLLAELQQPDVNAAQLDALIGQDVSLSYRLLRYINSAFFALPRKVESIQRAVVFLGLQAIKTWVSLIALSGIDDKPHDLINTALVRAKMCERMGELAGVKKADAYFTTGLFSTLDAMMDAPMTDILAALPLSDELTQALTARTGPLGLALQCVLDYERGDWDAVSAYNLAQPEVTAAYLHAIGWADEAASTLRP